MSDLLNPNFFKSVVQECHRYNLRLREIDKHRKGLENLGFCQASVIWRTGHNGIKNMYLLHPTQSAWVQKLGKSRYEYVGAKEQKQQVAYDRLARNREYHELKKEAEALRHKLQAVNHLLSRIQQTLFGSQLSFTQVNGKGLANVAK